jgi:hypothetical protein
VCEVVALRTCTPRPKVIIRKISQSYLLNARSRPTSLFGTADSGGRWLLDGIPLPALPDRGSASRFM